MAVLNGRYSFPEDGNYSGGFRDIVKMCLIVKPEQRPDIEQVSPTYTSFLCKKNQLVDQSRPGH